MVAGELQSFLSIIFACIFTGLGGLACGRAFSIAKEHPDTTRPLLACTAGSALVGVALGVSVAAYRKAPLHVYGLSLGANFALCSFTFFGEIAFSFSSIIISDSLVQNLQIRE